MYHGHPTQIMSIMDWGGRMIFFSVFVEFHCTFPIYYKIHRNYLYYCILIRMVWAIVTSFFFRDRFTSFHTHGSLLTFFVWFFVLFHSCCPMRECLRKHSCMSSTFPIAILNGTCFFLEVHLEVHNVNSERENKNS